MTKMSNNGGTQMDGRIRSRRAKSLLIATVAAVLTCVGAASAGATPSIEGVWSFEHGAIDVVQAAGGGYEGIVSEPTVFSSCTHEDGEKIWTAMTEQAAGYYWGKHEWFLGNCKPNPVLGPTAWRILTEPSGSYYLRVCFSNPGSGQQPEIDADGGPKEPTEYSTHHVTYGCVKSELITPSLPTAPGESPSGGSGSSGSSGAPGSSGKSGVAGIKESLELPSATQCLSGRQFKIHLPNPKYDPFKSVTITLHGRKLATKRKGNYVLATVNLRGLHKGAFTLKIDATTILGHHLTATRTYHTCAKKKHKQHGKKG